MNTKAGCWWLNTVTPVMLTEQQWKVRHHKKGRRKSLSAVWQEVQVISEVQICSASFPTVWICPNFLPRHLKVSSCVLSVLLNWTQVCLGGGTQKVNNAFRFFHDMKHRHDSLRQSSRHCSQTDRLMLKEQSNQKQNSSLIFCPPPPPCWCKVRGNVVAVFSWVTVEAGGLSKNGNKLKH